MLLSRDPSRREGRQRRLYSYEPMNTPYERLKSLPGAERFLKPGLSFATHDIHALAMTGNQAAEPFNLERDKRFQRIRNKAACDPTPRSLRLILLLEYTAMRPEQALVCAISIKPHCPVNPQTRSIGYRDHWRRDGRVGCCKAYSSRVFLNSVSFKRLWEIMSGGSPGKSPSLIAYHLYLSALRRFRLLIKQRESTACRYTSNIPAVTAR